MFDHDTIHFLQTVAAQHHSNSLQKKHCLIWIVPSQDENDLLNFAEDQFCILSFPIVLKSPFVSLLKTSHKVSTTTEAEVKTIQNHKNLDV